MRIDSRTSFGARIENQRASVASVIPKTLLFAPVSTFRKLVEITEQSYGGAQAPPRGRPELPDGIDAQRLSPFEAP